MRALPLLVVALSTFGVTRAQTTWYVDQAGTPPGSGTPADPYTSIQHAYDQATTLSGDVILVAPGTYAGGLDLRTKSMCVRATGAPEETILEGFLQLGAAGPPPGMPVELAGFRLANGQVTATMGVLEGCIVNELVTTDYDVILRQCTLADVAGDALFLPPFGSAFVTVENCVFWNNGEDVSNGGSQFCHVTYSLIEPDPGDFTGHDNFFADPLFWAAPVGDYHLKPGSPAIDAGDPASPTDPDGSRADVGAFPFDPAYVPEPLAYCTGKTNSLGCIPFLTTSGTPSATGTAPFRIIANDMVPEVANMFYGFKKTNLGFHGAKLCVKSPFQRLPHKQPKQTGAPPCEWTLKRDFNVRIQTGADPQLTPGQTVFAQWRGRDPAEPQGFGDTLTNGVKFTIAP